MNIIEHHAFSVLHPQTRRHLENGQRLRAAAIQEFAKHGLQGAKVSNIVAAAQLTQPSFYRTWPSKEAAYAEIVLITVNTWQDAVELLMAGPDEWTLEQRLTHGMEQLFSLLTQDLELTRMVLESHKNDPDWLTPFIETYVVIFRGAQCKGWVTTRLSAETLAQATFALLDRFFQVRLYLGQASLQSTIEELIQLILPMLQEARHE